MVLTTHNASLNHWRFLWLKYAEIIRWSLVGFGVKHYNTWKAFQQSDAHISLLNHLYANLYMHIYINCMIMLSNYSFFVCYIPFMFESILIIALLFAMYIKIYLQLLNNRSFYHGLFWLSKSYLNALMLIITAKSSIIYDVSRIFLSSR